MFIHSFFLSFNILLMAYSLPGKVLRLGDIRIKVKVPDLKEVSQSLGVVQHTRASKPKGTYFIRKGCIFFLPTLKLCFYTNALNQ